MIMSLQFYKYHGAGNDFIIIDEMRKKNPESETLGTEMIAALCHRKFGIGADGLMLLRPHPENDFRMIYYNSNGLEGSMCGNGGRCLVAFAKYQGYISQETDFMASDGIHKGIIWKDNGINSDVSISMQNIEYIKEMDEGLFLDTGSPHLVRFVENLEHIDVFLEGKKIRNSAVFAPGGTNVNFVEVKQNKIHIRTFERGVENETLACGTGITAAAISTHYKKLINNRERYYVNAKGGELAVSFTTADNMYRNVMLQGPVVRVFKGEIDLQG
ncbi:MAG: diaminopimelate epimerase [Bacteroidetes bacterium]|nr:MAG: diaminopimelate epimerase [Bacteroidota bacterium]